MPEKRESGYDAHEIDQDYSAKFYIAEPLIFVGIEIEKKVRDFQFIQEVEEFIEEPGFTETIDFGDIFSIGEIFCDPGLIS
jgi:hypothetical protein